MNDDGLQFEHIYLTDADYYEEGDGPVLWCYERIRGDDVEYVNVAAFDAQAAHIAELEVACESALNWYGPDGDHINEPQRSQLLRALGKPGDFVGGDARDAYITELETKVANLRNMLKWAREFASPPIDYGYFPGEYEEAMREFDENCNKCSRLLQGAEESNDD